MSFKVGIAVSVLCAVPLLASMIWDMSQMGDRYILIGAWTGLVVGTLIGFCQRQDHAQSLLQIAD